MFSIYRLALHQSGFEDAELEDARCFGVEADILGVHRPVGAGGVVQLVFYLTFQLFQVYL